MAAGDLIVMNNQYEVDALLMGSATPYITNNWVGLEDKPDMNTFDLDRQDAWGVFPGLDLYKSRVFSHDVAIEGVSAADVTTKLRALRKVTGIRKTPVQFVWQRPNGLGKRFVWVNRSRAQIPDNDATAHGLAQGSIEWTAADPRIYSLQLFEDDHAIPAGQTQVTFNVSDNGDESASPLIQINGPATNPRITNQQDSNRVLRIDIVLAGTDSLVIDAKARTVALNGGLVGAGIIRVDNQWWALQPGVNQLVYSRSDSGASSAIIVQHRDVWVQ